MSVDFTEDELNRLITVQDLQALGQCVRGQRRVWEANRGLTGDMTFERFIKEGVTVRWILSTGNPYAVRMAYLVLGKEQVAD